MMIPVFKPFIIRKDIDAVLTCLVHDALTSGTEASNAVSLAGNFLNCHGGAVLRDYYNAILLALDYFELEAGAAVIAHPFAPALYHAAFKSRGIEVHYCDINPDTLNFEPQHFEQLMQKNIKAVFVYHKLGFLQDMELFEGINIPLAEDVSEAFGASAGDIKAGASGSLCIVSLEAGGMITASGGGMLLCPNKKELPRLKKCSAELQETAFLTDLNAALVKSQIHSLEKNLKKRNDIHEIYVKALQKTRNKTFYQVKDYQNANYSFPVVLRGSVKEIFQYTKKNEIEIINAFDNTAYDKLTDDETAALKGAKAVRYNTVLFPLYPALNSKNIGQIVKVLAALP